MTLAEGERCGEQAGPSRGLGHGEDFSAIGDEGGSHGDSGGGGVCGLGRGLGVPFGQTAMEPEGGGHAEDEAKHGGRPNETGEMGEEGIEQEAFSEAEASDGFEKESGIAGAALEVGLTLNGGDCAIKAGEREAGGGAVERVGEEEGGERLGGDRKPDGNGEQQQADAAGDAEVEAAENEVDAEGSHRAGGQDKAEFGKSELGALLNEAVEHSHTAKVTEEEHAQGCGKKRQHCHFNSFEGMQETRHYWGGE